MNPIQAEAMTASVGLPIRDLGTGMCAVQGIFAALYERQRTGMGRLVECSLLETAIGFSSWTSAQMARDYEEPTRQGSRDRQNAPYQRMQDQGQVSDGGGGRRGNLGPLCQGFGAPAMVRGPAVICARSDPHLAAVRT